MKLRELHIKNFRGIRDLDWQINQDMVGLIGPGDSTKTTILLALEYLFYPSQNLPISEVDFHNRDVNQPVEIRAIITDLPTKLGSPLAEDKYGLHLGFWNPQNGEISKAQHDGLISALQVSLKIEKDLEPKWFVNSLQEDDREPLVLWSDIRRSLGVAKIGQYADSDLAWGRNSALSRLTQKEDFSKIPSMLSEAERNMADALGRMDLSALSQAVQDVDRLSKEIGVQANFQAGVSPAMISIRQGAIGLHDNNLPFTVRGSGSRRLLAMAIHKESTPDGAIILIDEIENSLEPHRIRHLLRQVRPGKDDKHQVIFTTHSPVAVVESSASELHVVRTKNGNVKVRNVKETFENQSKIDIQKIVRAIQEAFLSPGIIICEGKTEAGFLIALDQYYWQEKHKNSTAFKYQTMAEAGITPVESPRGGGSESPQYALAMVELGYRVAYFGDSDRDLNPSEAEMKAKGVEQVFLWDEKMSIEERLCQDLPWEGLKALVDLAVELHGSEKIWQEIRQKTNGAYQSTVDAEDLDALKNQLSELSIREVIGAAAKGYKVTVSSVKERKRGEWFKRMDKSKLLGELVAIYLDQMKNTPTYQLLALLEQWAYG